MTANNEIDLSKCSSDLLKIIPYDFLKRHKIFPLEEQQDRVIVATENLNNFEVIDELRLIFDKPCVLIEYSPAAILTAIDLYYGNREGEASAFLDRISNQENTVSTIEQVSEDEEDLFGVKDSAPVIHFLNLIFKEAVNERVSDIHFEPFEDILQIRYRIDGVLQIRHTPSAEYRSALITRIKVLAKLDIAEHRLPQDGRIKLKIGGKDVDMRVSTVPVINGERIVLRILDRGNVLLDLDCLGMPDVMLSSFRNLLSSSEGIILVTGPTGSGKTTTLYSAVKSLLDRSSNIMTIEDPPEYKLNGISQVAVKPKIGLTFSQGLRHLLRQDPDVLMVGEIRDLETAEIAVQASLTGHLVLSTLHTNDSLAAVPRLTDMGIPSYLLSSTIQGIVAQRLVRKICRECAAERKMTSVEREFFHEREIHCAEDSVYEGKGCEHCFGTGYKFRHGIYELFQPIGDLKSIIATKSSGELLKTRAYEYGFKPLLNHGAELVLEGLTTVHELLRVAKKAE
ncbi:MAG: GspE/PulE family protein [Victivallaceae bacterium]